MMVLSATDNYDGEMNNQIKSIIILNNN